MNRLQPTSQINRLRKIYNSLYFAPVVIFLAISLITYGAWQTATTNLHKEIQSSLDEQTNRTIEIVNQKLTAYEQIITGGAGLIRGSQEVTKDEWRDYVSTFDKAKNFAGIKSIGYIKVFTAEQIPAITTYMQGQGLSDFVVDTVSSVQPRDVYSTVLYSDLTTDDTIVGRDLLTYPWSRTALFAARNSGLTHLSLPITPKNNNDEALLMLFTPQYRRSAQINSSIERQQAIEGYTYAAFSTPGLLNQSQNTQSANGSPVVRITTQDISGTPSLIYESARYQQSKADNSYVFREQVTTIYGQTWKLDYGRTVSDLLSPQRRSAPASTATAGLLFALLLAIVTFLLLKARARQLASLQDQAVNLAKDELLSLASHQLRTPATAVKQYLGMVLQGFAGDISQTQNSLLSKAYAGNERQLYIINEMLHLAKIDSGRIVLAKQRLDIVKLVHEINLEAKNDIDESGHTLRENFPKKPIFLRVDEHMLRMAIENIVSNAIKYTPQGGRINVKIQQDKTSVFISVKDNGIGIEQKDFSKLYKLFTRLDNERMQHVNGTGVGLYLAKHLVGLHKGQLRAESTPNKGSVFTIILPLPIKKRDRL